MRLANIPAYAIALPERTNHISEELRRIDLTPMIIPATDMRNKPIPSSWTRKPSDLGCTLSWLDALKQAYDDQHEYVVIFEDDFVIRFDTLKYMPPWSMIEKIQMDVIYLTGHYAKGATRAVPRRIMQFEGLVKAFGIHTTPGRVFRREYLKILRTILERNMVNRGFGVDTSDAILQVERQKTYALEAHIGGQRSGDSRSWEPRCFDPEIACISEALVSYPDSPGLMSSEEAKSLTSIISRENQVLALNCSLRVLCLLCEGAIRSNGKVVAYNTPQYLDALTSRPDDRLRRYIGYGVLSLRSIKDGFEDGKIDGVCIEIWPVQDEEVLKLLPAVFVMMSEDSPVLAFGSVDDATKNRIRDAFRAKRTFRSAGSVLLLNVG